jgi:hypothetical protein
MVLYRPVLPVTFLVRISGHAQAVDRFFHRLVLCAFGCLVATAMSTPTFAADDPPAAENPPPFTVAGTAITSRQKSVLIVTVGKDKKENHGKETWVHEGESFGDYKVIKVNKDKVLFEHKGKQFLMAVGYGRYSPRAASSVSPAEGKDLRGKLVPPSRAVSPALPAEKDKQTEAKFVPPPENVDEVRANAQSFLSQLRKNPEFMKQVEELRQRMLKQQTKNGTAPAESGGDEKKDPDN